MQFWTGVFLVIFPGILFVGQIISSINFSLAQKLGLQEDPAETDQLLQRAEKYVAYWDLFTMGWMPLTGVLMVLDYAVWPLFALFSGAIYFDTAGREAAKILSFKHEGIKIGAPRQQRFFFSTYIIMLVISIIVVTQALIEISDRLI